VGTEILVNIGPQESRVALVENAVAQEIHVQRNARHGLVGSIYKGIVRRVLPGMQAAFVEIGLERTAFLHVADMFVADGGPQQPLPSVERLLREGQDVLVQILKDPLGTKGARLTTLLSIPSRYLVLMPFEKHVGVSAKIEDEAERERLRAILERLRPEMAPGWGVIARTAAEGVEANDLAEDLRFLTRLWQTVEQRARAAGPCSVVHTELPLSMRVLRDLRFSHVDRIRIDNAEECQRVQEFAAGFLPELVDRVEHYAGCAPIFDLYGVEDDLNRALERKVELKCGGHLVIDQTEAMTTIDVNTGQMTRKRTRESLGHILCEPCPTCEGRGSVKTVDTVCHEIAREVQRSARKYEARSFLVLAAPNVVARLAEEQSGGLADLEAALKRPIKLQAETLYAQDSYDVVPL
jgi:ribonuclease G